jgi:hypothetical protein
MPCRELQKQYGMTTNRATPEWGKAIFSDLCVILRPQASKTSILMSYLELVCAGWGSYSGMAQLAQSDVIHQLQTRNCSVWRRAQRMCLIS